MSESFPRLQARTQRFTLGVPRAFTISPDGKRVVFLRTKAGDDPVTCLWEADAATGTERLIADPRDLGADEANLPPEERARRERVRETAGGIVSYTTDSAVSLAVFALAGQVFAARLGTGTPGDAGSAGAGAGAQGGAAAGGAATPGNADVRAVRAVATRTPALDPRPDPTGHWVAYVHEGTMRVAALDGERGDRGAAREVGDGAERAGGAERADRMVAGEPGAANVAYGLAEFVAAEEMDRTRGYWWSPDGTELLVARVDETPVNRWHIADPANPGRRPAEVAYPSAGTPNALVSLHRVTTDGGGRGEVEWDHDAFPYLVTVNWDSGEPLIVVQTRDQKTMRLLDGSGDIVREYTDPHWTDIVAGVPARLADGRLVTAVNDSHTRRLFVGDAPVTPAGLQVRAIVDIDGDTILFTASTESTQIGLWSYGPDGLTGVLTRPGVHGGRRGGGTTVTMSRDLDGDGPDVRINGKVSVRSLALRPNLPPPAPVIFGAGEREVRTAVLLPSGHRPGTKLPVLMDPYGGPLAQRVLASRNMFHASQWFAEQGFAVVIADGRGTPGRGPGWDRAVAGDLAGPVLEDQVAALHAAAEKFPDLDLGRVGIRGWSFGGYLAALAVLRRPDVFHAAIAGAPVTDWRLYDTHYTERYLGIPGQADSDADEAYDGCALVPGTTHRPLLLIHGLADDNVVSAHTLRLSSQLLAAGYPHSVLPLSGVTHMTPQEVVAENLLLLQAQFMHDALDD